MPTVKLTERALAKLQAPTSTGKQGLVWDSELKGFAVLLSGATGARSFVVQRTLPGGRTRRITVGPCNVLSLADARSKAETVLAEFYAGRDPKGPRGAASSLREALQNYLQANNRLAPASRRFYSRIIERHLADWLDLRLQSITPEMVQARHTRIAEAVAAGGRSSGHAMANSVMTALGIVFNHVAMAAPALINPVRRLNRQWFPEVRRTRMVKFDRLPEFYRAVCALQNPIHRDLIALILFTGLRKGEASGLSWDEVDFGAAMIRIPEARMKARKPHDLPMSDLVRDLLVARRAQGKGELVFLAARDLKPSFKSIAAQTGITVSPHDLRRTFITAAESADISPMALKRLVAHAASDVTSGYVQLSSERLREAAQRVADRLKTLCEIVAVAPADVESALTLAPTGRKNSA